MLGREAAALAASAGRFPRCSLHLDPQFIACGFDGLPFAAQRLHHDRLQQCFDIGPARVMRADLRAFIWIENAFEEGTENRRFDVAPIERIDERQRFDFVDRDVDDIGVGEQAAVEVEDIVGPECAAVGHRVEQLLEQLRELLAGVHRARFGSGLQHLGEDLVVQQANVLGEHREHELHEEVSGVVGRDAALPHAVGDLANEFGGLRGDGFGRLARTQGFGIGEDTTQQVEVGRFGKLGQAELVYLLHRAGKIRVDFEAVEIANDEQRRVF